MTSSQALVRQMKKIFRENGSVALEEAKKHILFTYKDNSIISQSLRHFSKITLHNTMPVFPALITISAKAVGGDGKQTIPFGKAIVLITGAADLHDDVIDKSPSKGAKLTVAGKFGEAASLLAGDILLVEGLTQLYNECDLLSKSQAKLIKSLVSDAILEISKAETLEAKLKGHLDLSPSDFYEVIRLKAVVPELTMKIGAILANAEPEVVESFGQFGRNYGLISIVSDDCADIFDPIELTNRLKNECAPLPLIYALQNPQTKQIILPLLSCNLSDDSIREKLIDAIFNAPEMQSFIKMLIESSRNHLKNLDEMVKEENGEELKTLLLAPLAFLASE
jgi:geranylgeranyl pyrophosphate synthase